MPIIKTGFMMCYSPRLYPIWNFLPGQHIYIASVVFSCCYFQHAYSFWPWRKYGTDKQLSTIPCWERFLLKAMWQLPHSQTNHFNILRNLKTGQLLLSDPLSSLPEKDVLSIWHQNIRNWVPSIPVSLSFLLLTLRLKFY